MSKLKKEELLGWLDKCWSLYKTSQDEWELAQQAYKQIESLIQKKPEVAEEWIEEMPAKKAIVDEEFVEKWKKHSMESGIKSAMQAEYNIRQMLIEVGVEIVEK